MPIQVQPTQRGAHLAQVGRGIRALGAIAGTTIARVVAAVVPSNLLFAWHCETTDVTTGTPAGSSVGDTTAIAVGTIAISTAQFQDGTHSVLFTNPSGRYEFAWADDIMKPNAGTADFWIYVDSTGNKDVDLLYLFVDGSNRIRINYDSTNGYIAVQHIAGGTLSNGRTNTSVITTNTWYHCKVRWSTVAQSGLYLKVTANTTDGETNSADNGTSALGTWSGSSGTFNVGDPTGNNQSGSLVYIDDIAIYNNWQP